jgi:hypothetical protein
VFFLVFLSSSVCFQHPLLKTFISMTWECARCLSRSSAANNQLHTASWILGIDLSAAGVQVKCQAHGTSTRAVLAELWGLGSKRAGVAALYRGLGTRAAVAVLVGAFYLSSFHFFRCI